MGRLAVSDCIPSEDSSPVLPLPHGEAGARRRRETFLELGALPSAVPCARLHVRQVLWEWGTTAPVETIELIATELVTNAIHASQGLACSRFAGRWAPGLPPVRLWMTSDQQRIMIQVWDGNPQVPVVQDATSDAESGRGLLLVASLSADWGTYTPAKSSGKVVWAAVDDSS